MRLQATPRSCFALESKNVTLTRRFGEAEMKRDSRPADAAEQYAAAHTAHYATKDLPKALALYRGVMASHPNTREAGYAHAQIQNIVNSVVPDLELLDVQADLAFSHLMPRGPA